MTHASSSGPDGHVTVGQAEFTRFEDIALLVHRRRANAAAQLFAGRRRKRKKTESATPSQRHVSARKKETFSRVVMLSARVCDSAFFSPRSSTSTVSS